MKITRLVFAVCLLAPFQNGQSQNNSTIQISDIQKEEFVAYHNAKRVEAGADPVKWSAEVARTAQEWADEIARTGKWEHRPHTGEWATSYGENLGAGSGKNYHILTAAKDC